MVICDEIYLATHHQMVVPRNRRLATSEELEGMYYHMEEALLRIGFLDQNNPKRIMAVLRRISSRARLNPREVKILRGICRQAHWYVDHETTKKM
jgi:tRNA/rRNA methyltransferase